MYSLDGLLFTRDKKYWLSVIDSFVTHATLFMMTKAQTQGIKWQQIWMGFANVNLNNMVHKSTKRLV